MNNDHWMPSLLAGTHPLMIQWLGRQTARQQLAQWLDDLMSRLGPEGAQLPAFALACPVAGVLTADYATRHIGGAWGEALACPRFYGGATELPFVDVVSLGCSVKTTDIAALIRACSEEFAAFEPQWLRLWVSSHEVATPSPRARIDNRLFAAPIEAISFSPKPLDYKRIGLEPTSAEKTHQCLVPIYEAIYAAWPSKAEWLPMATQHDLQQCAEVGACFMITVDGTKAGVIAAKPDTIRGIGGWTIQVEALNSEFRGRGLAPAAQRLLSENLSVARATLIIGTIDERNPASWKTAERVGRMDIGGWWFLPLVGTPGYHLGTPLKRGAGDQ